MIRAENLCKNFGRININPPRMANPKVRKNHRKG